MSIQYTSNKIAYETNWTAKTVCLLPNRDLHTLNELEQAKRELDGKYPNYDIQINWENT